MRTLNATYVFLAFMGFVWLAVLAAALAYFLFRQPSCAHVAKTEGEAKRSLKSFFLSNTAHSRRIIASLQNDGATADNLAVLLEGCPNCYAYKGGEKDRHPGLWYIVAPIASSKSVVLLAECSGAVFIERELYGGQASLIDEQATQ